MEKKLKLGVIFGGQSTENEVSVQSAMSVIKNLDKEKYDIFPIYIDKDGVWYKYLGIEDIKFEQEIRNKEKILNIIEYLKSLDVIFPVLHGLYGEDGTIQGFLELLNMKYVGCKVLASSVGMDKAYTKILFEKAKLNQAKYVYIRLYDDKDEKEVKDKEEYKKYCFIDNEFNEVVMNIDKIVEKIAGILNFPVFIKPSNSGSSVGINKARNKEELKRFIKYASKFDNKILIEEEIKGKEVECAVLGNDNVIASTVGEIKSAEEFYSFDAKYKNEKSQTVIPADLPQEKIEEIRKLAIKAFKTIDGKGLSRVDFFVEENTSKVYINEINTMPGFTNISMYPKLFENEGIKYNELLDKLISCALGTDNFC